MSERIPAQCWPVGHFLAEEMRERGWSCADVAERMGGTAYQRRVWELTVDLILHCSDEPDIVIGQETCDALGAAFGVHPSFWSNLNESYQTWRKVRGVMPEPGAAM